MLETLRGHLYRLLRKSERYVQTDMVYLAKGGIWLFVGHIAAAAVGLTLSIGFANLLPPDTFGIYKYVLSVSAMLGAFSLTGMGTAVSQAVARGKEGILLSARSVYLRWGVLVPLLAGLASAYYFFHDNQTLAIGLLIAGASIPLIESFNLYAKYLEGKKLFRTQTIWNFFRSSLPAITLLATLFLTKNPVLILLAYYASNLLISAFLYRHLLRRFNPPRDRTDTESIAYAKHLSAMGILGTVATQLDKVLVFQFLGAAPLAVYAFALAPVQQLRGVDKILQTLMLPKLSTRDLDELQKAQPNKMLRLFWGGLAIALLYIAAAPLLYNTLFQQYTEAIFLSQLYALSLLLSPAILPTQTLLAHAKKRELYITKTVHPLFRTILLLILIPSYGLVGAVLSLLIARSVNLVLVAFMVRRIR